MKSSFNATRILREAGFRATPGRITLLILLAKEQQPRTVEEIHKKLGRTRMNEVTLYRALEALVAAHVIHRVDFGHGHAYYEFSDTHHHHIVCTSCGTVEDFSDKHCDSLVKEAVRQSSVFKVINNHAMELFGVCRACAN